MRIILFLTSLALLFSCSNDTDNQNNVTIDNRSKIEIWKLISIKNDTGDEISNDCELENGKIIVQYGPMSIDPLERDTAIFTEGKMESSECRITTTNNILWYWFGDKLITVSQNIRYNYDCLMETENGNLYMSTTLTSYEDGPVHITENLKTCKYIRESVEYLD